MNTKLSKMPLVRLVVTGLLFVWPFLSQAADPLSSWNDGPAKESIINFVSSVTDAQSKDYVDPTDRVAVFDNDGTLWSETPIPFQAAYAFDEIKRRSPDEPQLAADPMVQAVLDGDVGKLLEGKHHDGLMQVLALTHAGMTTEEFDTSVTAWLKTAKHPRFQRAYDTCTYVPMQQLLGYLRANDFKCFIVSGGGADFMRVWSERVYGIPPENVVGSTGQTKYVVRDGEPLLIKTLDHLFVDDREGKPVGIHHFIGRRPIACFGNSDGDQAMMEYTTIGNPLKSFGMIIHHTDADREYAYDADPPSSGKLTTAMDVASERGWTVVDMKTDWRQIFGDESMDSDESSGQKLFGNWLAEDIEGRGVVDRAQSTLTIAADGSVSGSTSVNRYHGMATINQKSIKFGPLATTRRAGPPALMDQEKRFAAALEKTVRFRIAETGLLYFSDVEGNDVLRLSKMND
ncbi:META domain-containing protein [Rubripirellula reticaptiva]|uniref:META domain protein n=1 Tax=Rubripirellula reticaptiva TaxID=2528013 RepID=A0A5C6F9X0_9BACT|nr:META domain-containing protein [Rubripirellula reticaptiva]TWU56321.1 META domain protein [Rubripirellula reticaptiva]